MNPRTRCSGVRLAGYPSCLWRLTLIAAGLLAALPGHAEDPVLVSRAGIVADTGSDASSEPSTSADGRYTAFASFAANLVVGQDSNHGDVFLRDRIAATTALVSHQPGLPTTVAGGYSFNPAVSADGNWVAFESYAATLAGGLSCGLRPNVFLYERSTGTVTLVSHVAGAPLTCAGGVEGQVRVDAAGDRVVFVSSATNLVTGQVDSNAAADVFAWDRASGALTLVSHASGTAATTANGRSEEPLVSASGQFVSFRSLGTNLVNGQVDTNAGFQLGYDIFQADLAAGLTTLVSHSWTSTTKTLNGAVWDYDDFAASDDGSRIAFASYGTDGVAGQTDTNGLPDVYFWDRGSNTSTLVSHVSGSPTATGNNFSIHPRISGDGNWVGFNTFDTNLVAGETDTNGRGDVVVWERATGIETLASHSAGSTSTAANSDSWVGPVVGALDSTGALLTFNSTATNLVPSQVDNNDIGHDVFVWRRGTNASELVSRSASSAGAGGDGWSDAGPLSSDGTFVVFTSASSDLEASIADTNGLNDVWGATTAGEVISAISLRGDPNQAAGVFVSTSWGRRTSTDGRFMVFTTRSGSLVPGVVDSNDASDVYLFDRLLDSLTLVSHRAGAASHAANDWSDQPTISADGIWVAFSSWSSDLVSGATDTRSGADIFLWNRNTNNATLVSHVAGSPLTAADAYSREPILSADGRYLAYSTSATNLVAGQSDPANARDVVIYDRQLDSHVLASHLPGSPVASAGGTSQKPLLSDDGNWVAFESSSTSVVSGQSDANSAVDVFLFDRVGGGNQLVSGAAGSSSTTANGASSARAISADGGRVVFESQGTNLVPGEVDGNGGTDVFLFTRGGGAVLVSRSTSGATVAGNGPSGDSAISGDGRFIAFDSDATDLVAGVSDGNLSRDVFLFDATTGTSSLVSHMAGSPLVTANGRSVLSWLEFPVASKGRAVVFGSSATNLQAGVADGNGLADVFRWEVSTGTNELLSHVPGSPLVTPSAGGAGSFWAFSSPDGQVVFFLSESSGLASSDHNGIADLFVIRPTLIFADGFEETDISGWN